MFSPPHLEKSQTKYNFDKVTEDDLIKFGFLPEFIGRSPVITPFQPLEKQDLKRILVEPVDSLIKQYQNLFKPIELYFTKEALEQIAEMAHKKESGARALKKICEDILLPYKYELYGSDEYRLFVTKEMILHPEKELARRGYNEKKQG